MTLIAQAVMAEAQSYVRAQLLEVGRVGVCALLHYDNGGWDVVHANDGEAIEEFMDFAFRETAALDGFATTLIHQWCDDVIAITVNHLGAIHTDTLRVSSSLGLN